MKKYLIIALVALAVLAAAAFGIRACVANSSAGTVTDAQVEESELILDSIKSIGQWELSSIDVTIKVDTLQRRWLGIVKDKLQRRYYGTASVGIEMQHVQENWFHRDADTLFITLPPVTLLDENFIDESKTETVLSDNDDFERNASMKKAMLQVARQRMKEQVMTPNNVATCQRRAIDDLTHRFTALGFARVVINFNNSH